jgi:hypothetical protein
MTLLLKTAGHSRNWKISTTALLKGAALAFFLFSQIGKNNTCPMN